MWCLRLYLFKRLWSLGFIRYEPKSNRGSNKSKKFMDHAVAAGYTFIYFFFRVILILYNRIKDSYIIFGMDKVKILLEIYNIFVIFYTESAKDLLTSNKI